MFSVYYSKMRKMLLLKTKQKYTQTNFKHSDRTETGVTNIHLPKLLNRNGTFNFTGNGYLFVYPMQFLNQKMGPGLL